ncbi:MAG: hypothetical protein CVU56_01370 [Deltaproteobacteria bacterium HGW-Deltaproteobacteria-14]|nr:MAG: hypothetical protein CVU56_01370 [Deltaproteobacteria bacterium HGW-Deltaproteobacteria-14]
MRTSWIHTAAVVAMVLGASCGSDPAAQQSDTSDTSVTNDTELSDIAADAQGDAAAAACPDPLAPAPDAPDASQTRFALALFHFNLQYVIGGLEYVDDAGVTQYLAGQADVAAGWDNDRVEDWIITETFEPILDVYARHPSWRVDLELQAYMVEVMAARHPGVLAKLQALAWSGQAELVSFHWADQLFLAFPAEDLERSVARTREVFAEHCLPLSGVVFNQEGQAGEGRQRFLVDHGYTVGVFPKNLWRYVQGDDVRWPYYASEGATLIVGPGGVDPASGVEVAWTFFDDGELRATANWVNPYVAPLGGADADRIAEYEAAVAAHEAAGWKITSVSDFVRQLEAQGIEKRPAPPLLDGTWQAPSTDSIHRWLGGRNEVFIGEDEDNPLRTGNARARALAAAAQVMLDAAEDAGVATAVDARAMAAIWEDLWRAEVSDGSGVNPWAGEIVYCGRKNAAVTEASAALRATLATALGLAGAYVVDLSRRTVTAGAAPVAPSWQAAPVPEGVTVDADAREVTTTAVAAGPVTRVTVAIGAAAGCPVDTPECDAREVRVGFARADRVIAYSPGLIEDEVRSYPEEGFSFLEGQAFLPLANGLIGLGEGRWLVKHTRSCHIAARVATGDPEVAFIDRTIHEERAASWVFDLVSGTAEEALSWANAVNIAPTLAFDAAGGATFVDPQPAR